MDDLIELSGMIPVGEIVLDYPLQFHWRLDKTQN